jgi:hypothetical protein
VSTLAWSHLAGPAAVAAGLEAARPWLLLWRLALYGLLLGGWGWGVERIAAAKGWRPEHTAFVRRQRLRIAVWLALFELVLVQNVVGRALGGLLP